MTFPPQGQPPARPQQPVPPIPAHPEPPTQRIPQPQQPQPQPQPQQPLPQQPLPQPPQPQPPQTAEEPRRWWAGDKLSVVLVFVIIGSLGLAGLLGGELYARHTADSLVANAVSCVIKDGATASFGMRPMLLQVATQTYSGISVTTAGNQIREAKGMKLELHLDDVHINKTAESAGTLGSLVADVTWSSDGIKDTAQGIIPVLGNLVDGVSTDPANGTIELDGGVGSIVVKPRVDYGKLSLQVMGLRGLGAVLPRETVQPALDAFTNALTANLPMGIHADRIEVTDTGVHARFVTADASIPNGQQDACFAGF